MSFAAERTVRQERQNIFEATKPLLEKLNAGTRLSVEERADLAERHAKVAALTAEIKEYEDARSLSDAASAPAPRADANPVDQREADFSAYVKRGVVSNELRAAGEATGSAGGYLIPPGWWQRLQVATKAFGGTSNDFESLETESGQPMQWATVDPTTTVGTLISENTQISDVDYVFGTATLSAYMFTSGAQKVSIQLANDSAFSTDAFVSTRVGESLGRARAQYAISGTGTNQPLGINPALTAKGSAGTVGSAITQTGGFLNLAVAHKPGATLTGGTPATELVGNYLAFDTILSIISAVDASYRGLGAKWYLNDQQALNEMAITDLYGHPLWQPSVQVGAPDTLYRYPVQIDNNIPNLAASTVGGPIFGHLPSAMVLRTVTQSGLLRLTERYADYLQVGYIGYERWDSRSNDLRAAVVVKPAAT